VHLQGLTEEQAVQQYGDVDVYTSSFRPMRNTISGSPLRTFMKLVVDATTDKVMGCHMVGDDSAEIMQVRLCLRAGAVLADRGNLVWFW
jgi:glutathione reductase (NADPH)